MSNGTSSEGSLPPQGSRIAFAAAGGGFGGALLAIIAAKILEGPCCCCAPDDRAAWIAPDAEPVAVAARTLETP